MPTDAPPDPFPKPTENDWQAAVAAARRGKPAAADDVAPAVRPPLYQRRANARPIPGRAAGTPWRIVERIAVATAGDAARRAAEAIAGGATGIDLVLASSRHPLAPPATSEAPSAFAAALAGVLPDGTHVRIDAGALDPAATMAFVDLAKKRQAEIVLNLDPAAAKALDPGAADPGASFLRATAAAFDAERIAGAVLVADGRLWHAGGATEELELGATLAAWAHHVRLLDRADRIGVALALDADQFRGIAKIRAMRLLLARVMEVGGVPGAPPRIHVETAWRMLSASDPDTNILRATGAAFAGAVGGADSMTVLPHDVLAGGSEAARRLARNTQVILAGEAHLGAVADPAAGSGALEATTQAFAEGAWKQFRAIEAEGGIFGAIAEGALLRAVAEAREARLARIARGDIRLVGVNAFRSEGGGATVRRPPVGRSGPLAFRRLAGDFEPA